MKSRRQAWKNAGERSAKPQLSAVGFVSQVRAVERPGWFIKNVAVDSKKARRTCSTSEGSFASSNAAFINCIHLSRAAVPIGKRACRMRN